MAEELKKVQFFDNDLMHVYIDGKQYIALDRYVQIKNIINKELVSMGKQLERLTKENEAYKVLLCNKLNEEVINNGNV